MTEFKSELAGTLAEYERRGERYLSLLRQEGDLASVVLRGHLILEELLYCVIQSHCASPEHLGGARLRFPQLVALCRSLDKLPTAPDQVWNSLNKLNALRNSLAHHLEPSDLSISVSAFALSCLNEQRLCELAMPPDSKEAVVTALCFLLGQLQMVAMFSEAFEYLIIKQASEPSQ